MLTTTTALPAFSWRGPFLDMLADYQRRDPANGAFYQAATADFQAYLLRLEQDEQGVDLPVGYVPCSHRWLIAGDALVAVVRIRHHISNPYLSAEAGHIGYDVAPSWRRLGYGIAALQAGLAVARKLQIPRVLLCADSDNPASWRTIERCGGTLECEELSVHAAKTFRRYRITVS
jgi:predicted acetyltransferase